MFRDGRAVALLDFDFAAPGRRSYDLAAFARMCVPIDDDVIARGGEWARRHAEAGEPGFVQMWAEMGGQERYDRRRQWWAESRSRFERALG